MAEMQAQLQANSQHEMAEMQAKLDESALEESRLHAQIHAANANISSLKQAAQAMAVELESTNLTAASSTSKLELAQEQNSELQHQVPPSSSEFSM